MALGPAIPFVLFMLFLMFCVGAMLGIMVGYMASSIVSIVDGLLSGLAFPSAVVLSFSVLWNVPISTIDNPAKVVFPLGFLAAAAAPICRHAYRGTLHRGRKDSR